MVFSLFGPTLVNLVAFLYPFNAKYDIFQKLKKIYPMHYVPEVLMTTLTTTGIYLLTQ